MENSKTLIVIVSVSLFVAAVLGLGLVLFYPREAPQVAGTAGQSGSAGGFDAIEYLRDPDAEEPTLEAEEDTGEDEDVVIVYGETVEERPEEGDVAVEEPTRQPGETQQAPERSPERRAEPAPAEPTPAEPERAEPARAAPRRAPEPQPEPRRVQVTEYWIQVIATTSPDRVQMARERLREHQLSGRITTRVVDGRTFYRLRVGPYTDKREATKFLDWVNDIDGFEDSYISEEYSMRTVQG